MGLLDGMDDPQRQFALMMASGLLANPGQNIGQGIGNALPQGLMAYNQGTMRQAKMKEEEQQRQMRELAMAEAQRRQQFQSALASGINPGNAPTDGMGPVMPPSADFSQAMKIDPMMGMQAQAQYAQLNQRQGPQFKEVGGRLVAINPDGSVKEAYAPPEKKKFQDGDTRVIESGRTKITYEMQGGKWVPIAKSAVDKPEGEAKPMFNEAAGGFIVPPSNGKGPSLIPVPGMPASQKNAPSEAELTAAGYASRMNAADALLNKLPADSVPGLTQTVANNRAPTVAPYVSTPGQQQYRQAQEDWVRAKLRKESGAVIADEEMAREIRVYFPQPGDSPEVIKQKMEARKRANASMLMAAGKATGRVTGGASEDPLGIR